MQTTARPGGTHRPARTTIARISDDRSARRNLPAAVLLSAILLAAPSVLHAQPSDDASGEDVTARVGVEPVVRVSPQGPVAVRFPSPGGAAPTGEPVEARTDVRLSCAGNTLHEARIRLASSREGPSPSERGGELQWTTGGVDGWSPLGAEPARVVGALEAGSLESCATVRFRWVPEEADPTAAPPAEIPVVFEGASVPRARTDADGGEGDGGRR